MSSDEGHWQKIASRPSRRNSCKSRERILQLTFTRLWYGKYKAYVDIDSVAIQCINVDTQVETQANIDFLRE